MKGILNYDIVTTTKVDYFILGGVGLCFRGSRHKNYEVMESGS